MKIKQEDFNKLNQLDRIEYRQSRHVILIFLSILFMVAFVAMLFSIHWSVNYEVFNLDYMDNASNTFFMMGIFSGLMGVIFFLIATNNLNNFFFDNTNKIVPNVKR